MAAKGGVWTKKGFVKAADRKDNGGVVAVAAVETDNSDPVTKLKSSVYEDINVTADEADRILDEGEASGDNQNILIDISATRADYPGMRGLVVKDKNGNTQALAVFALNDEDDPDTKVYVELLATHPRNMDKNNPDAVRGAGSQAMAKIAKIAQERGVNVELGALPSAIPFYKKLGFERNKDNYWELSGDKLKELADRAR